MNNKISGYLKERGVRIIIILGLAGMALILFSDILSGNKDKKESSGKESVSDEVLNGYESYVAEMEQRLESELEKINGVGKADVMITASGSGEYVYAKDENTDTDENNISREEKYVIIGGSSGKQALVRKIDNPEIMGVVVVCEGGDSNVIKEKVYSAVSAAFNIPSGKIFVAGSCK